MLLRKTQFQFTHPGKGATACRGYLYNNKRVSIHAPWEGCDSAQPSSPPHLESFNSRTLGRVRRLWKCLDSASLMFQFTHPGKGATATAEPTQVDQEVSIHAPREGCDSILADTYSSRGCFNSRTPGGVRLISVTFVPHSLCVSIHAPREGCDTSRSRHHHRANSFNSRTPGGVRLALTHSGCLRISFNSRTPGGVRPEC